MIDVRKPSEIKVGMIGIVKEFDSQKEKDFREGEISKILSSAEIEPNGTKVELLNGSIGNLQFVSSPENNIQMIENRLNTRENQFVERKSTFAFDINEDQRNDDLKTVLSIAVASFMNSNGGFVYVGVSDDGTPLGLKHDYSLISRSDNDGFEDVLKQFFNKTLTENMNQQKCLTFTFPIIKNIEICEIHVKPSDKPIFIKPKFGNVVYEGKKELICQSKKHREIEDFYIRRGNSHYLVERFSEFYDYVLSRFT